MICEICERIADAVRIVDETELTRTDPAESSGCCVPNGRFKRSRTYWEKGELLGRGSFGSVYEGISK